MFPGASAERNLKQVDLTRDEVPMPTLQAVQLRLGGRLIQSHANNFYK